jgi:starvation-inducible DNA-binding protein
MKTIQHAKKPTLKHLRSTRNDLSEKTRRKIIGLLNTPLRAGIELQTQTKQSLVSVNGPCSITAQRLFDEINEEVKHNVRSMAERAVQLGWTVEGTTPAEAAKSAAPEGRPAFTSCRDQIIALAESLATYGKNVRQAIRQSHELGDVDTAITLTRVSRGVDKWLWMVQAHLQES